MGTTRMQSSRPDDVVDFVLRNRDMASLIFAFQDGFPQDIIRLKQAVDLPAFARPPRRFISSSGAFEVFAAKAFGTAFKNSMQCVSFGSPL
ncbi:hypothetical protein Ae201684P_006316 [Aphanomyces euteiches]|uniref:Uncharacterized protein n=1 Tax=Aphanomyces euteiches TaxID=100861 RepID=A0A6G0XBT5_9STRA|nr:hypothetical protein Ae201684_006634 [Aphanomyces euteiches]KAH9090912.1 hypothetical protein Ae201684P_006316 [Aphanomyces euteiches]